MRKLSFRVLWTETAVRDLESLIGYIAADALMNAERVLARLAVLDSRRDLEDVLLERLVRV